MTLNKKIVKNKYPYILICLLLWQYSVAQKRVITTGVPFLLITSDARAAGMGELGVASSPDAYSQQWNPSKYAFAERKMGVGVSYTPYLSKLVNDIFLANLTYYNKISERGAWAASLKYFSLGDIELGQVPEDFINPYVESPNELTLDASYSLQLSDQFAMAVTGRFIRSDLKLNSNIGGDADAASTFSVDVSGYYQSEEKSYDAFNGRWRAGFNISNLGPKLKYDEGGQENYLPTNLRLGGGFEFLIDTYNSVTVNLEVNKLLVPTPSEPIYNSDDEIIGYQQPDVSFLSGVFKSFNDAPDGFSEELNEVTWALGLEYWYNQSFAFRAGYFNENEDKGARKLLSFGAGFKYNTVDVDLSYLISASKVRSPLENTLRFSLTFNFGDKYEYF